MRKNKAGDASPSAIQLDLLLVLYEEPRRSGDLVTAVERVRGDEVALATFYRQLQRAADVGWVEESGAGRGRPGRGRPEREYRITESGAERLREGMRRHGRRVELARSLGVLAEPRR